MNNREAIHHLIKLYDNLEEFFSQMGYHLKKDHKNALILAISALEKQEADRWIPVTERLPEYGTVVLTQLSDNDIVTNWVIDEEDEEWFEDDVIAWKPLPELFQEEE